MDYCDLNETNKSRKWYVSDETMVIKMFYHIAGNYDRGLNLMSLQLMVLASNYNFHQY